MSWLNVGVPARCFSGAAGFAGAAGSVGREHAAATAMSPMTASAGFSP
jgi:hypothetical protein